MSSELYRRGPTGISRADTFWLGGLLGAAVVFILPFWMLLVAGIVYLLGRSILK